MMSGPTPPVAQRVSRTVLRCCKSRWRAALAVGGGLAIAASGGLAIAASGGLSIAAGAGFAAAPSGAAGRLIAHFHMRRIAQEGAWFSLSYAFFGTQLAPAFDYADFEIGYRDELIHAYPAFARDIDRLTRGKFAVRPAETDASARGSQAANAAADAQGRIFDARAVPEVAVSPGVDLRELVGRVARDAHSASLSAAEFSLAPGRGTALSYNLKAEEVLLVTSGSGSVRLNGVASAVRAGSTVFVPPLAPHEIAAVADQSLVFYAISTPAFKPDDYVIVAP